MEISRSQGWIQTEIPPQDRSIPDQIRQPAIASDLIGDGRPAWWSDELLLESGRVAVAEFGNAETGSWDGDVTSAAWPRLQPDLPEFAVVAHPTILSPEVPPLPEHGLDLTWPALSSTDPADPSETESDPW